MAPTIMPDKTTETGNTAESAGSDSKCIAMSFDTWWPRAYQFCFGVRWLEPLARHFAKSAYECGRLHERKEILGELEEKGDHYSRHVNARTIEAHYGLADK